MDENEATGGSFGAEESYRGEDAGKSKFWDEARARSRRVGEKMGEGWDRVSGEAQEYAREHSVGVALGSLALGLVAGVLIGALISRD